MRDLSLGWSMLLIAATISTYAGTETATDGLRRCSREADEKQRLACFDALASAVPQIKTDQFGMTAAIAHTRDPTADVMHKSELLTGKITELRQAPRGEWIFTLDNGQIWIQAEAQPSSHFIVGEAVHIEHGALSSLWLVADHNRKTRVKRQS